MYTNTKVYQMTTQRQVRAAFWEAYRGVPGISKRKITNYSGNGTMHNTDTRCAFNDFVDSLSKDGSISEELASRVTL
jgi:hypothetical protein